MKISVGDYGRITKGRECHWEFWKRTGIFVKDGNIYEDGKAGLYGIREPKVYSSEGTMGTGVTWIVSNNAEELDLNADASACVFYSYLWITVS